MLILHSQHQTLTWLRAWSPGRGRWNAEGSPSPNRRALPPHTQRAKPSCILYHQADKDESPCLRRGPERLTDSPKMRIQLCQQLGQTAKPMSLWGWLGPGLCTSCTRGQTGHRAGCPALLISSKHRELPVHSSPWSQGGGGGRWLRQGQHWATRLTFQFDFYAKSDQKDESFPTRGTNNQERIHFRSTILYKSTKKVPNM